MNTTSIVLKGREFCVASFSLNELAQVLSVYEGMNHAIREVPLDPREIFALQVRYSEVLFEAMKRVQPELTRSELNDVPFDEIAQAVARAIELCAPPSASAPVLRRKKLN